jgi:hypothetical protein
LNEVRRGLVAHAASQTQHCCVEVPAKKGMSIEVTRTRDTTTYHNHSCTPARERIRKDGRNGTRCTWTHRPPILHARIPRTSVPTPAPVPSRADAAPVQKRNLGRPDRGPSHLPAGGVLLAAMLDGRACVAWRRSVLTRRAHAQSGAPAT